MSVEGNSITTFSVTPPQRVMELREQLLQVDLKPVESHADVLLQRHEREWTKNAIRSLLTVR